MPEAKRQLLLSVFAQLKQKVIWKWEVAMHDAPPNVLVSSWLPQQDLLASSKVLLFLTHGGAGSIQETICHKTLIVDPPQHPLDRAVWWLEYLLRHPHNHGMRSPALQLAWHQYFLLDVIGFFLVILSLVVYLLHKLVLYCCTKKVKRE